MFERFTQAARRAVVLAQEEARRQAAATIGAEHLLFGVLSDTSAAPARVLRGWGVDAAQVAEASSSGDALDREALSVLGIDLDEVRRRADEQFGSGALDGSRRSRWGRRSSKGHIPFVAEAKASLVEALKAAVRASRREIGPTELFLGLLATEERTVPRLLQRLGVTATPDELERLVCVSRDEAA